MKTSTSNLVSLLPLGNLTDTNTQKLPEIELLESTLDYMPDMIYVQDNDFVICLVNSALCQKFGFNRDQIIGKNARQLFPEEIAEAFISKQQVLANSKELVREEELIVDRNGESCLLDTLKIPLIDENKQFQGVFSISRDITHQKRQEQERERLISSLKDALAMLERQSKVLMRLNNQLKDLATTDELTQVNNRRYFEHRFDIEWRRCKRERAPLAIMIVDIDHFKLYNDRYGHNQGDFCLQAVASALSQQLGRPGDVFARYGGEEFVALLPNTSEGLEALTQKCTQSVQKLNIQHDTTSVKEQVVTVSIGSVVGYPHLLESSRDLLELADQHLYLAKQQGRNTYSCLIPDIEELEMANNGC